MLFLQSSVSNVRRILMLRRSHTIAAPRLCMNRFTAALHEFSAEAITRLLQ